MNNEINIEEIENSLVQICYAAAQSGNSDLMRNYNYCLEKFRNGEFDHNFLHFYKLSKKTLKANYERAYIEAHPGDTSEYILIPFDDVKTFIESQPNDNPISLFIPYDDMEKYINKKYEGIFSTYADVNDHNIKRTNHNGETIHTAIITEPVLKNIRIKSTIIEPISNSTRIKTKPKIDRYLFRQDLIEILNDELKGDVTDIYADIKNYTPANYLNGNINGFFINFKPTPNLC